MEAENSSYDPETKKIRRNQADSEITVVRGRVGLHDNARVNNAARKGHNR